MPEQDVIQQWKSFSPEQRSTALGKMSFEQKVILKNKIETYGKPTVPNPVKDTGVSIGAATGPMPAHKQQFQAPLSERVSRAIEQPLEKAAPMVGATVGAFAGGPVGAGIGAAAGSFGQTLDPKEAAISGGLNALLEGGGNLATAGLSKFAAKAGPKAAKIVSDYLGLPKNLPKLGRTVQNAREISRTVLEKVGVKPNLEAQKAAIETTRQAYDDATKKLVQGHTTLYDIQSNILDRAVRLDKRVSLGEFPEASAEVVDANLTELSQVATEHAKTTGGKMTPAEMHAMRKSIQQQISDWNPETKNVRQRFLQDVYHDLNDGIARALPPKESRQYLANNRIQSKLITARNAASATLLKEEKKATPGLATKALRAGVGAVAGAGVGGFVGMEAGGHVKEGALTGAALGALGTTYAHHLPIEAASKISTPRLDVAAQKALEKSAKALAKVSKATPQTVRTLNAIQAVQSRPQQ